MKMMNRRTVLQMGAAGVMLSRLPAALAAEASGAAAPAVRQRPQGPAIAAAPGGKLRPRGSASIAASPLSVGMETLDRKMFDPEKTYAPLAQLGVKWARVQTGWARTERRQGEYDFAWLDQVVDALLKIGIQPWFNVGYGNTLYTPGAPNETAVGFVPINSAEARAAWTAYVERLAAHFRGRVRHFEIWNEVNNKSFWRPYDIDPKAYADFVRITSAAIRKPAPDAVIVGFALYKLAGSFDYLKQAFEAGIAQHIDKVSYHPYQLVPEANYTAEVRSLRRLIDRYKPGIAIWQGENGAPSQFKGAGHVFEVDGTEDGQARWLLRRILTDLSLDIELTSYFHTCDLSNYVWSTGASNQTQKMGLLRTDYTPKASYYAYRNLCALFDSGSRRADLLACFMKAGEAGKKQPAQVEGIWSAAFLRGGHPLYAYWWPGDLSHSTAHEPVDIELWPDADLANPVLIDPLSGDLYDLTPARRGGYYGFAQMPLYDYPLLIADRRVLAE